MYDNSFEKFPGEKAPTESELNAEKWQSAMSQDDVPAFAGDVSMNQENAAPADTFGVAPEVTPDTTSEESFDNDGISDAASIVNYGLNAAAREYGVEAVVQKIKTFDASGSENPIRDLFLHLGIDTPAEIDDVKMEREAAKPKEADFYGNSEVAPPTKKRSPEGAFKAIKDMKELILEVEGADPRYAQLRAGAKAAGKGYFEYAVGSHINRGLTDLFDVLAAQPEVKEVTQENPEAPVDKAEAKTAQSDETQPDAIVDPEETIATEGLI